MNFNLNELKLNLMVAVLAVPVAIHAQIDFSFQSAKAGYQASPNFVSYEGGLFQVTLVDGSFTTSPCFGANRGDNIVTPFIFCPLGTNSYIQGFGDSDVLTGHWSLAAAPIPARFFATDRPDLMQVMAGPLSLLPRPQLLGVTDHGLQIGYSYTSSSYKLYRLAEYNYRQTFDATSAERRRHDETLPHGKGAYIFGYPQIQTPAQIQAGLEPNIIPVSVDTPSMPESYPGVWESPIKQGFRFINGVEPLNGETPDGVWNNGRLELDPVYELDIQWEGLFSGQNINFAVDTLTMWVENQRNPTPLEGMVVDNIVYPIPGVAIGYNVPPTNAILGVETLPPFYFGWEIGDEVYLYLRMDRNANSSAVVKDTSYRVWCLPIRFITTYRGFAYTSLPAQATDELREPDADYDLDGFSNFIEYAANTDPDDITSTPAPGFPNLTSVFEDGKLSATVSKRPNVGSSLVYDMEWSTDMVTWTKIEKEGDATWDITDSDTELTVKAKVAGVPSVAFLRAKLTLVY